jgi:hypothetical protein
MGNGEVNRDETFELLSNHRRRYALHYCKRREEPVTLSDLAEQVAAWEQEKPVEEVTSSERKRTYTSLQQTHLPAMEEAGIIEWDDAIELTPAAERLNVYMDIVPEESVPWGVYYLWLSAIGGVVLGLAWLDLVPVDAPDLLWAGLVVAAFAVSAAVHVYRSRQTKLGRTERPPELE